MADEKDNRIVVFRKEMRIVMKENVKKKKITAEEYTEITGKQYQ